MTQCVKIFEFSLILLLITGSILAAEKEKPPEYIKYVDEITNDFVQDMEKKYGLHCYGSGGSMPNDVEKIEALFTSYRKSTIEDARKMEVNGVQALLKRINSHEKIRPSLREYPFTPSRIGMLISFRMLDDRHPVDGSVALVFLAKDTIFYDAAEIKIEEPTPFIYMNEKNEVVKELVGGGPREKLVPLKEESYEEALKILGISPPESQK